MFEYKGYIGVVDYDPEIDLFHGTVINTQDVITFYGASVTELRDEMQKSLEVYFEVCEEQGEHLKMKQEQVINQDPEIHEGTPVFTGTRVPVRTLIDHLKTGESLDYFLEGFPSVSRKQAIAFLEFALTQAIRPQLR